MPLHEVFTHGTAGIGGDILHGCKLRCGSTDNNGIVHSACHGQIVDDLSNSRTLLTDGNIDTDDILALLVQDGICCDGGLTGLTVADDQLTLAASDRDHGVDSFDTGLKGNINRLAVDDAGSRRFDGTETVVCDGALTIDGFAQCVDDTANQGIANGNGNDTTGTLDGVAFLDAAVIAKDNNGDGVFVQVLCHAVFAVGEFNQLAGHALIQSGDRCDTVADNDDSAGFAGFQLGFVVLDLTTDDFRYFFGS